MWDVRDLALFTYMAHEMSDYIDSVKESLTDQQYKEGMDLCKTVFEAKKREKKLYKMTYLAPYTFRAHCDDGYPIMRIGFQKKTGLVQLNEHDVKFIENHHRFTNDEGDIESFIDTDPLSCFPLESDSLDGIIEWWEFPVLSLEECG